MPVRAVTARLIFFAASMRIGNYLEMVDGHVGQFRLQFQRFGDGVHRFFRDYAELFPTVIPQQRYNRFGNLKTTTDNIKKIIIIL